MGCQPTAWAISPSNPASPLKQLVKIHHGKVQNRVHHYLVSSQSESYQELPFSKFTGVALTGTIVQVKTATQAAKNARLLLLTH